LFSINFCGVLDLQLHFLIYVCRRKFNECEHRGIKQKGSFIIFDIYKQFVLHENAFLKIFYLRLVTCVAVGKTKKAARNAAAERVLKSLRLWTAEDEAIKMSATVEVDEDPVTAVFRMQDVIAQEREMHSLEQMERARFQPLRWGADVQGSGILRGRGKWNGSGGWRGEPRWRGPRNQSPPAAWSNHGPDVYEWNHFEFFDRNKSEFSSSHHRGRSGAPPARGFRGGRGYTSETFLRNMPDTLSTSSRGGQGTDGWIRGARNLSSSRGNSGMTRFEKLKFEEPTFTAQDSLGLGPSKLVNPSPSQLKTGAVSSSAALFGPSPITPWTFGLDPSTSTYLSAELTPGQNVPSTSQAAPASYMPPSPANASFFMGDMGQSYQNMNYTAAQTNPALGGLMQAAPSEQTATIQQTDATLMYAGYGRYDLMYSHGAYTSF